MEKGMEILLEFPDLAAQIDRLAGELEIRTGPPPR
jgi:hypothetical protein